MKKAIFFLPLLAFIFSSCLGDDDNTDDYSAWRKQNEEYVARMEILTGNGAPVYTKVVPSWAPGDFVLMKWHNDRSLTEKNLVPLSNSLVKIKYEMEDIEGNSLGDSYSSTTYGDSIYQSRPNQNIVGMWAALTSMHVGDSVTMIIPAVSAYGSSATGKIKPYSALIYHVKMKGIPAYDK